MKALFILLASGTLLGGCASQQQPLMWNAETLSGHASTAIRLQDRDGQTVATVSTSRIKNIVEATRKIEWAAGIYAQVVIFDGKEPNAFASRGADGVNRIGFTIGMLDLLGNDYDAYAAIIGHELAHLVLDHGAVRRQREQTRSGASTVLGIALGAMGVPMGGTVANLTTNIVATSFTRDEERDADTYGIRYATQAGFDPHGAVRAWEKMAARSSGPLIPFLSTHPMATERVDTMRRLANAPSVQPLDSPITAPDPVSTVDAKGGGGQAACPAICGRLRPIGVLKPEDELLPGGDLFVDMNTVRPSITDLTSKRALILVNLWFPSSDGAKSYRAQALVNCHNRSLALIETVSTTQINGEGAPIGTKSYAPSFKAVGAGSAMASALDAVCEH